MGIISFQFAPEHFHTDGRCGISQFLIERSSTQNKIAAA
jgi:hypothetical protein